MADINDPVTRWLFDSSDYARKGLAKIADDGTIKLMYGLHPSFKDPAEAFRYLQNIGITGIEAFRPDAKVMDRPGVGGMLNAFLEGRAKKTGYIFYNEIIHSTGQASLDYIKKVQESGLGIINPGEVMRITHVVDPKTRRELSEPEARAARAALSEDFEDKLSKVPKRMNAILTTAPLSHYDTGRRVKVGIRRVLGDAPESATAEQVEAAREVAEMATEGIWQMSPEYVRYLIRGHRARINEFYKDLKSLPQQSGKAIEVRKNISALEDAIGELKGGLDHGARFSGRSLGLDVVGLDGLELTPEEKERYSRGLLKGDFVIVPNSKLKGVDIVGYEHAIKSGSGLPAGEGGFTRLDPIHTLDDVFVESQVLVSHPSAFDLDEIAQFNQEFFDARIAEIKSGKVPDLLLNAMKKTLSEEKPIEIPENIWSEKQAFARRIVEESDVERIAYDPAIQEGLIDMLAGELTRAKPGGRQVSRLRLPDAAGAHMMDEDTARLFGLSVPKLKPGEISFHPTLGFIGHGMYIPEQYKTHGGPDFDDLMLSSLRWDPEKKRLVSPFWRWPTEFGEMSAVSFAEDDSSILEHIWSKPQYGKTEALATLKDIDERISLLKYGIASEGDPTGFYARALAQIREQRAIHLAQHVKNWSQADEIMNRAKGPADQLMQLGFTPRHELLSDVFQTREKQLLSEAEKAAIKSKGIMQFSNAHAIIHQQVLEDTKGLLGRSVNAGMVMSDVSGQIYSQIDKWSGAPVIRESLESMIDDVVLASAKANDLKELYLKSQKDLARMLIFGKEHFGDKVGLSNSLMDLRYNDPEAVKVLENELKAQSGNSAATWTDYLKNTNLEDVEDVSGRFEEIKGEIESSIHGQAHETGLMTHYIPEIDTFLPKEHIQKRAESLLDELMDIQKAERETPAIKQLRERAADLGLSEDVVIARQKEAREAEMVRAVTDMMREVKDPKEAARVYAATLQLAQTRRIGPRSFTGSGAMSDIRSAVFDIFQGKDRPDFTPDVIEKMIKGIPGTRKAAEGSKAAAAAERLLPGTGRYVEKAMPELKKLWEIKSFRVGSSIALGAAVFGEVYKRVKDRTPESVSGPPLLPGGSPYEGMMRPPMAPPSGGTYTPTQSNMGTTYQITGSGGNVEAARQQAEQITGTKSGGSIFHSLKRANSLNPLLSLVGGNF